MPQLYIEYLRSSRFMKMVMIINFIALFHAESKADFPLQTHGWLTLESYVHGQKDQKDLRRSHRSEFIQIVDIFTWKAFTFTLLMGNTTDISQYPDSIYYLDRIIYTYTYGGRLDMGKWVIRGDLHHDCIHLINRPEIAGSTWWNAYLLRIGSKGAFNLYLAEPPPDTPLLSMKRFDGRIGMAYYKKAAHSLRDGQNHNFHYEFSNLLRYQFGNIKNSIIYADLNQQLWLNRDDTTEYKGSVTINILLKGHSRYAGLFYEYHFYDTFVKDLENHLGEIGFRILF
ncbi:MAG: hypothetical protein K9N29_01005 [Candidatus Marinimicrobia bacterium]|nr:hypothetical protein [Candidatus Neomarinimicrobiota bacterium]